MNNQVVCVTTFRQGRPNNPIERVRTEVFIDSIKKLGDLNIPCIALVAETQTNLLDYLKHLGAILVTQKSMGMGNIRREAISAACSLFPDTEFCCWLEPEKPNLSIFIYPMVALMSEEKTELGMFNRVSMTSYPIEQAYYYLFCRAVASKLIGFDLDYAFGPMIMSKAATQYFLDYKGEYGDRWEAIMIPRLRIMKQGIRVSLLNIDFKNDPRMTEIESGDPDVILERIEQLNNVIPSLIKEWAKPSQS